MDFVNVLRGLKKSRSEAKLGLTDRLSVGRKSSKTRIKSGGGAPIGDIPEDSTAPSLHSPPPPARQPFSQTGKIYNFTDLVLSIIIMTRGMWTHVRSIDCFYWHSHFPASVLDSDFPICSAAFPAAFYASTRSILCQHKKLFMPPLEVFYARLALPPLEVW